MLQVMTAAEHAQADSRELGTVPSVSESEAASSGTDSPLKSIVLSRDQTRCTWTLPKRWLAKNRDAKWQLRIELPDGFQCEPGDIIEVSGKQRVAVRIYDTDAKTPRSCLVLIVSKLARENGFEFILLGSAEDASSFSVPLPRKWLDPLKQQVKLSSAWLRGQVDSLASPLRLAVCQSQINKCSRIVCGLGNGLTRSWPMSIVWPVSSKASSASSRLVIGWLTIEPC